MSKASDIRTALSSLLETTLPGYQELSDSIDNPDNPVTVLDKGYSIAYGAATNVSDVICPGTARLQRTYTILLCNEYTANLCPDYRNTLEDALLDDLDSLVTIIEQNNVLNGLAINSTYTDDGGVEYLETEAKQFIVMILNISVDYFQ